MVEIGSDKRVQRGNGVLPCEVGGDGSQSHDACSKKKKTLISPDLLRLAI